MSNNCNIYKFTTASQVSLIFTNGNTISYKHNHHYLFMSNNETKVEIKYDHTLSWKALGRVVAVALFVFISWKAVWIIVDLVIAIVIATALFPYVQKLNKKISLLPSIIIVLTVIVVPLILLGIYIVPIVIKELPDLLNTFYSIINHTTFLPDSIRNFNLMSYANQHSSFLLASSPTIFLMFVSVLTIFFSMFYFILDYKQLTTLFLSLFPSKDRNKINSLLSQLAIVNGQYIRGNIIISIICGLVLFVGLILLGVPYALPLAIIASIMDLLPLVGSTLGAIPAIIIAFTISPLKGFLVLILHLVYQQTENSIISPAIYNKTLNLSPALGFLSVVVGGGLFGIIGAFLALPIAASIPVLLHFVHDYNEKVKVG